MDEALRILVVDDSELFRQSTHQILEMLGNEVVGEAGNGREAIAMTQELQPDLILMDIEMPQMSGIEAARRIQMSHPTPVVLLTAYNTPDFLREARDAGVAAYLVKPLNPEELQRMMLIARARFEDWMTLRRLNEELAERNVQLQKALKAIKTLRGLLPICAWCGRKIETEDGTWVSLESYIEAHSEAEFTHGICPDCLRKMRLGAD
ncbi:MAG: ANTAR domain-containing response regulator [Anaerolineae bacterium]